MFTGLKKKSGEHSGRRKRTQLMGEACNENQNDLTRSNGKKGRASTPINKWRAGERGGETFASRNPNKLRYGIQARCTHAIRFYRPSGKTELLGAHEQPKKTKGEEPHHGLTW